MSCFLSISSIKLKVDKLFSGRQEVYEEEYGDYMEEIMTDHYTNIENENSGKKKNKEKRKIKDKEEEEEFATVTAKDKYNKNSDISIGKVSKENESKETALDLK